MLSHVRLGPLIAVLCRLGQVRQCWASKGNVCQG
jgi:hypothetical protein